MFWVALYFLIGTIDVWLLYDVAAPLWPVHRDQNDPIMLLILGVINLVLAGYFLGRAVEHDHLKRLAAQEKDPTINE